MKAKGRLVKLRNGNYGKVTKDCGEMWEIAVVDSRGKVISIYREKHLIVKDRNGKLKERGGI